VIVDGIDVVNGCRSHGEAVGFIIGRMMLTLLRCLTRRSWTLGGRICGCQTASDQYGKQPVTREVDRDQDKGWRRTEIS